MPATSLRTSYISRQSFCELLSAIPARLSVISTSLSFSPASSISFPAATCVILEKRVLKLVPIISGACLVTSETVAIIPIISSSSTPVVLAMFAVFCNAKASSSTLVAAARSTADILSTTLIAS